MCDHEVNIKTISHSYDFPPSTLDQSKAQHSSSFTIEKPTIDIVPHPPKGDLRRTMHNPNKQDAHNKNVVMEIAQAPCFMSAMEVLQYCPTKRKELLSLTRAVDPSDAMLFTSGLYQSTYRIPSKVAFQIKIMSHGKNIFQTIVDEGTSTCVMSFKCWKALGSPTLIQSHTVRKVFDGKSLSPHGLIVSFPIEWGNKTIIADVEVVDWPIDHNFLLGCSWIHEMMAIVSLVS